MKAIVSENRLDQIIQESINNVILEMSPALLQQAVVIQQFEEKHGKGRYDYSKVRYVNDKTHVIIGCPMHKKMYWFLQTPHNHKRGDGCPLCRESKMESEVRLFLEDNNTNGWCPQHKLNGTRLALDFYIEQKNLQGQNIRLGIECQGEQHYHPIKAFGGQEEFAKQQVRDTTKANLCNNMGITLEYIKYDENVNQRILEIFKKYQLSSLSPSKEGQFL